MGVLSPPIPSLGSLLLPSERGSVSTSGLGAQPQCLQETQRTQPVVMATQAWLAPLVGD